MSDSILFDNIYNTTIRIEEIESLSPETQGKNSTVFIGKDLQMGKKFLIKKINIKNLRKSTSDIFEEAKILANSMHRNIMPLQYSSYDEEYIYMAIPYFKNGSLNEYINKFTTNQKMIEYCLDFLSGLAHAHILGILHLDIKPSNIVIDDSDRALLTDFGQSHLLGDDESVAFTKPIYLRNFTPNILVKKEVCVDDDIYQVGLMIYRIFNDFYYQESLNDLEKIVNQDQFIKYILERKFPNNNFMPNVPNKIRSIIKKCLGRANDSYNSVIEVMNDLSRVDKQLHVGYEYHKESQTIKWRKLTETAIINIEIDLNSNNVIAKRENIASGNIRNVTKLNKSFNSRKDAFEAIKSHLEE
nr:MAG TPA: PKc [Caudoviricetes sp.]